MRIPIDELLVRAQNELPKQRPILIDCRHQNLRRCHAAALTLKVLGIDGALVFANRSSFLNVLGLL
jgi:protein tyrosine/serine phosphatase